MTRRQANQRWKLLLRGTVVFAELSGRPEFLQALTDPPSIATMIQQLPFWWRECVARLAKARRRFYLLKAAGRPTERHPGGGFHLYQQEINDIMRMYQFYKDAYKCPQ